MLSHKQNQRICMKQPTSVMELSVQWGRNPSHRVFTKKAVPWPELCRWMSQPSCRLLQDQPPKMRLLINAMHCSRHHTLTTNTWTTRMTCLRSQIARPLTHLCAHNLILYLGLAGVGWGSMGVYSFIWFSITAARAGLAGLTFPTCASNGQVAYLSFSSFLIPRLLHSLSLTLSLLWVEVLPPSLPTYSKAECWKPQVEDWSGVVELFTSFEPLNPVKTHLCTLLSPTPAPPEDNKRALEIL